MVTRTFLCACIVLLCGLPVVADTVQRIGAEDAHAQQTAIGIDIGVTAFRPAAVSIFGISPALSVQQTIANRFIVGFVAPGYIEAQVCETANPPVVAAFADPAVYLGLLLKQDMYRYRLQIGYTYPLGIWNEYQIWVTRAQSGAGYHAITIEAAMSAIRDPTVLNATLTYRIGLPRSDRFGSTMRPGDIVLSLSLLEILNDKVGISAVLNQTIEIPEVYGGHPRLRDFRYGLSVNVSVVMFYETSSYSVKVAKSIGDKNLPAALEIGGLHEINW